jgi:hypothetical protein
VRAGAGKLGGARGGSGGGDATWRSKERASTGWGAAGAVLERHVARSRAARGQLGLGKSAGEGGGVGRREKQSRGTGGRRRRLVCNL